MALVSPGISISVNDQSQYVNSSVGSVPLVLVATAENKTYNNALAVGTTKANAGKLLSFTSQRDLVTAMGTPKFQLSSAGTPINGSELNEYGLLTAYSALGLGNQLFAIRADIDLAQLTGTGVRPAGNAADGTYWLDLANTEFGIYESDATTSTFSNIKSKLLLITDTAQLTTDSPPQPKAQIGAVGSYALVFDGSETVRLFFKASKDAFGSGGVANWVQVNSRTWQLSRPVAVGTNAITSSNKALNGTSISINGNTIALGSDYTDAGDLATFINTTLVNTYGETEVKAVKTAAGQLAFYVTSLATDGQLVLSSSGVGNALSVTGIYAGTYNAPLFFYGTFAQEPSNGWGVYPTGSIWWKTTSTGGGYSPSLKKYSLATDSWVPVAAPMVGTSVDAITVLDPVGGGINIPFDTVITSIEVTDSTANNFRLASKMHNVITKGTGSVVSTTGLPTGSFTLYASATPIDKALSNAPKLASDSGARTNFLGYTITTTLTTVDSLVADILAANIPYVTAEVTQVDSTHATVTISHTSGGVIQISDTDGILSAAGFASSPDLNVTTNGSTITINSFVTFTSNVKFNTSVPYSAPADGTYWYYSTPTTVDIMINDGTAWRGYKNVATDSRGYVLNGSGSAATDPLGVIMSASKPTAQSDNTVLVAGDLWLDTSDLVNYPALSRYTGTTWVAVDNTDHVSSNGIVFADARWATDDSTNVVSDALPAITDLLTSDYTDFDAPDYRLYPRGTLLFNTRRSGYNIKKFVANYFNETSFPANTYGTVTEKDAWVSVSGLNEDGSLKAGSAAQRGVVVAALQSAVDSNVDIREDNYNFNLLVAPGYPELIDNLVMLNDDRGNTGFVIGDTPMTLEPTSTAISAWNNNATGTGLATASPYLGVYYPAGLTNDLAGNTVVVPASHAVLRTYLYNDNVAYQWFAPAGVHRGLVDNFSDIGYINATTGAFIHNGINNGLRDALYQLTINPITQLPGTGLVVWGQVTKSGDTTARNRVNVVRLENYLRTSFKSIANGFLFEPNDGITRKTLATQIESACHDLLSKRGLYDFLVICDSSNNTSSIIANNQLYVDVAIEPMKDVEFIYIPIALYNSGTIANLGARST